MTPTETVRLVALVCRLTPLKAEDDLPDTWHFVLSRSTVTYDEAVEAVAELVQRQTWISPAEVIAEVKAARKARLDGSNLDTAVPADEHGQPIDPDDVRAYREAVKARRFAVITGMKDRRAELQAMLDDGRRRALPGEIRR